MNEKKMKKYKEFSCFAALILFFFHYTMQMSKAKALKRKFRCLFLFCFLKNETTKFVLAKAERFRRLTAKNVLGGKRYDIK